MGKTSPRAWFAIVRRCAVLLLAGGAASALAQVPAEVAGVSWCPGTKNCLQWAATPGAASYRVYSGRVSTLPGLLNATVDSCLAATPIAAATGPVLGDTPTPCGMFWYLVDALNGSGEGDAGSAAGGARRLDTMGSCLAACAATGAACADDTSCCSGRCFAGTCRDACCRPAQAVCTTGADCCSGTCSGGHCAAATSCPYGEAACGGGCADPAGVCSHVGVCFATVPVFCRDASTWVCNYSGVPNVELDAAGALLAQERLCDGRDGNCNGVIDLDGFPALGSSCGAGLGACRRTGTVVCTTPSSAGCNVSPNAAAATDELCDGLDNDCDGLVDEEADSTANGKTYLGWRDAAVAVPKGGGGTVWVYAYEASRPGATTTSAGTATSRACSVSGVLPWATITEAQAAAACAAVKDSLGIPMRLCTAAEWQTACEGPTGAAAAKWSLSSNPATYTAQICNDVNEAATPCTWATGSNGVQSVPLGNFCYTDWNSAGKIRDLSGNLAEWTSTTTTPGGVTYYKLRGGSFFAPPAGTSCEFDGRLALASFGSVDVGFRCCADHAP